MTRITNSIADISRGLGRQFVQQINSRLYKAIPRIKNSVSHYVTKYLWESPTVQELITPHSQLLGVLGLDNATQRVGDVIGAVADDISITFKPFRVVTAGRIGGLFTVSLLDVDKIERLPSALIVSENSSHNWISMMLSGDKTYGFGFSWLYKPGRIFKTSRTQSSIIVPHQGARLIRVNPEHAGFRDDNFISKALNCEEFYQEIAQVITRIIL